MGLFDNIVRGIAPPPPPPPPPPARRAPPQATYRPPPSKSRSRSEDRPFVPAAAPRRSRGKDDDGGGGGTPLTKSVFNPYRVYGDYQGGGARSMAGGYQPAGAAEAGRPRGVGPDWPAARAPNPGSPELNFEGNQLIQTVLDTMFNTNKGAAGRPITPRPKGANPPPPGSRTAPALPGARPGPMGGTELRPTTPLGTTGARGTIPKGGWNAAQILAMLMGGEDFLDNLDPRPPARGIDPASHLPPWQELIDHLNGRPWPEPVEVDSPDDGLGYLGDEQPAPGGNDLVFQGNPIAQALAVMMGATEPYPELGPVTGQIEARAGGRQRNSRMPAAGGYPPVEPGQLGPTGDWWDKGELQPLPNHNMVDNPVQQIIDSILMSTGGDSAGEPTPMSDEQMEEAHRKMLEGLVAEGYPGAEGMLAAHDRRYRGAKLPGAGWLEDWRGHAPQNPGRPAGPDPNPIIDWVNAVEEAAARGRAPKEPPAPDLPDPNQNMQALQTFIQNVFGGAPARTPGRTPGIPRSGASPNTFHQTLRSSSPVDRFVDVVRGQHELENFANMPATADPKTAGAAGSAVIAGLIAMLLDQASGNYDPSLARGRNRRPQS